MNVRAIVVLGSITLLSACATRYEHLDVDGVEREFLVHDPETEADAPAEGWPVVIALHGFGQTARGMQRYAEFDEVADDQGFLVVYPNAIDRRWNDGRMDHEADDVAFVDRLIDYLVEERDVDSQRVYLTGLSNGGFMTHRLACEIGDKIAAAVPVAAGISEEAAADCAESTSVPMMMIWGTDDSLVPYEGGEIGFAGRRGTVLSAEASLAHWANANGCTDEVQQSEIDRISDDTEIETQVYAECRDQGEVVLATVEGGGHTWPGARPVRLLGETTEEMDTRDVWAFMARF